MRSSWVVPKSNDQCPYKRQKRRGHGREDHMKIETEIWKIQHKEQLESPEARKGKEQIVPTSLQRDPDPVDILISDFWFLELRD